MKKWITLTGLFLLPACANPQIAAPVGPAEYEQNCAQLTFEIRQAEGLRIAARDEDRFQWKYIFVGNAFVSAYRMNKAEMAAQKRLTDLKRIAEEKKCPIPDLSPDAMFAPPADKKIPRQHITQSAPNTVNKMPVAKDSY